MLFRPLGAVLVLGIATRTAAQQPVAAPPVAPADSVQAAKPAAVPAPLVQPAPDQARGVDAELRMSLFDLVQDRPLTAHSRLVWLQQTLPSAPRKGAAPPRGAAPHSPGAMSAHSREDLYFLLAESYYRLGLSDAFRASAQQLLALAPAGRYASLVQLQLVLDAYGRGDYTGARTLAAKLTGAADVSLADFVSGLAAYQVGDFAGARTSFAKVIAAGGPAYTPYARYMDALAAMQGDTVHAAAAFDALRPLAAGASGPFGDQVKLTASQLALRGGQFGAAAQIASQISPTGGLAPDAQLARAWAQYRAGQLDSAAALFGDFATRWPQLPGRDEARLMHGQILLEAKHPADADAYFTQLGDSLGAELTMLQARMNAEMAQTARALVAARAAGALFVRDAETGKSLSLAPHAGAENGVLIAAFNGAPAPPREDSLPPLPLTVGDLTARLDSIAPPLPADLPRRPLYAPASSPKAYAEFASRDEALFSADLSDAVAQYRLRQALADHAMRVAALHNLQRLILEGTANLGEMTKQINATQDSLNHMTLRLVNARQTLRAALTSQTFATAKASAVNVAKLDSLRASLGPSAKAIDLEIISTETETARIYGRTAAMVQRSVDSAISRHPAFALREQLALRLVQARALSVDGQQLLLTNAALVTAELGRLSASESDRTRAARQAAVAADQRKSTAEGQLTTMLDVELRTRATTMVEMLKRSREAADYGSASAAFFMAIDTKPAPAPAGSH
jgi:hypothetical protein